MITIHVRAPAAAVGIINAHQLKKATGLGLATVYTLWGESITRIEFETLDKLCRVFKCSPNDVLVVKERGRRR
jgi:DNA-binding Xre family transcriptional regulator